MEKPKPLVGRALVVGHAVKFRVDHSLTPPVRVKDELAAVAVELRALGSNIVNNVEPICQGVVAAWGNLAFWRHAKQVPSAG
tara:strand:- start:225 stop:470 length:246 start_codon:yes stop_codon:yes gene_type:complete